METVEQFESRKVDHIQVAMDPQVQARSLDFDRYSFVHEALPEIDFHEISIKAQIFAGTSDAENIAAPLFISSMTAGHAGSVSLNERLARAAEARSWPMGVGSQRRELSDLGASAEWNRIRSICPNVLLLGNVGLSQLIQTPIDSVKRLVDALRAKAMIVHLNPLQEVLQMEGTPSFRGGLAAIETLVRELGCPVVIKETGCGISAATAKRLIEVGVHAIDVAGRGGTHWGRIEGLRAQKVSAAGENPRSVILAEASQTFANWGLSTAESLRQVAAVLTSQNVFGNSARTEVWASGGIRSGLDAAKALALGASAVGVAQPLMAAALESDERLAREMERLEFELKTVLFCTGSRDLTEFRARGVLAKDGAL